MHVLDRLTNYLDNNHIAYQVLFHREVYTAQELAEALHTPGKELAKVVIVKADEKNLMIVLPARDVIDLPKLRSLLNAHDISIVPEKDLEMLFPGSETGAMPPFGNLFDMDVYVDDDLSSDEEITFNTGTHYEAIKMKYADFERLVHPTVLSFGVHV